MSRSVIKYFVPTILAVACAVFFLSACSSAASTSTPTALAKTIGDGPYQLSVTFESTDDAVFDCAAELVDKEQVVATMTSTLTTNAPGVIRALAFTQTIDHASEHTDAFIEAFKQCQGNLALGGNSFSWSLSRSLSK
ncbi:hypothetical protein RGU72_13880 [Undibacterium sp. 5I1]|uniref:hypothetical protein n=1 Tax=unclassified Undibacterium TaxID=2630295 RepID=UPI002AB3F1C6|nr:MULTISPECIES: hypothetical protein [unclassified Undibacterium]MDY7539345.1 hypothetical protein [Undibacterium sp. 5I1]MEB0231172.1 hypothetical protein [Undibacterium sp. 10I3]MEB0258546.1 hypothetical protein [Undibacterium sp. 5I1]